MTSHLPWALLLTVPCLWLTACGSTSSTASSSGSSSTSTTSGRPVAAPLRCPDLGTTTTEPASTGSDPSGALDQLVTDPAAPATQLGDILRGLAGGPKPLGGDVQRLQAAIAAEAPKPETAIEALARARWQHLDVDATLQAIGDAAVASCGTLFSTQALKTFGDELPAPASDGTVRIGSGDDDTSRTWPAESCDSSGMLGYAGAETEVLSCDGGVVVVDLASGRTTRVDDLVPADPDDSSAPRLTLAGDHLVWIDVDLTPASGLTKSSWTSTLHIADLSGKIIQERVLQADAHTVDNGGAPTGVAGIVDYGPTYLLLSGISAKGYTLTDATGKALGSTSYPDGEAREEPVGVIDVGEEPRSFVDEATGQEHFYGGRDGYIGSEIVNDGGCGANMLAGSEAGGFDENPAPDVVRLLTRTADGVTVTNASATAMFRDGDMQSGMIAALTPQGYLLSGTEDDRWNFYDFAGKRLWTLGDPVTEVTNVAGHIVARNTSDELIVVDPATGEADSALPDDLAAAITSFVGRPDAEPVGEIAYTDPASDSLLVKHTEDDGTTLQKFSYRAICG
jgi:hypothetical protein